MCLCLCFSIASSALRQFARQTLRKEVVCTHYPSVTRQSLFLFIHRLNLTLCSSDAIRLPMMTRRLDGTQPNGQSACVTPNRRRRQLIADSSTHQLIPYQPSMSSQFTCGFDPPTCQSTNNSSSTQFPREHCRHTTRNRLKMLLPRTLLTRNIPHSRRSTTSITATLTAKGRRCPTALLHITLMFLLLPNLFVPFSSKCLVSAVCLVHTSSFVTLVNLPLLNDHLTARNCLSPTNVSVCVGVSAPVRHYAGPIRMSSVSVSSRSPFFSILALTRFRCHCCLKKDSVSPRPSHYR